MYHIKEAAQLSGVSVKTLHHYDKIGLLVPLKSENGYRTYSQEDLERLQVILYYKYLGFSLEKIAELLKEERKDLLPHLTRQLDYLTRERQHLDTLISTLQKTIQEQKGERKMTIEEKFTGFSYQDNQKYHQEAVEKYGQEVMDQALEPRKVTKMRLRLPLTKFFKFWLKTFKLVCLQQRPKTKSKQPNYCKLFVLMDLTALLKYSAISVKATFTTQSLRKTLTSLDLVQLNTHQMLLLLTFGHRQNKNQRSYLC